MHIDGGHSLLNWQFSHISDVCDLDLGSDSRHMVYYCVPLTDLSCLRTKFRSNRKNFLWIDERTLRAAL